MKRPENTVRITADNSPTLQSGHFGVTYHSVHGAWTETNHVFIEQGLAYVAAREMPLRIFELGFGTGLNCLASLLYAERHQLQISYTTLEPYPLTRSEVNTLTESWSASLGDNATELLIRLHEVPAFTRIHITRHFQYCRDEITLEEFNSATVFDLVYFDAFAPETQPELWTEDVFCQMNQILVTGGALVTYCAKGYVKRNLQAAGFEVQALPGPPGKREMTRAIKKKAIGQR